MRLLVIGGTVFVGRAVVEEALARGHEVTVFHRGRSNPGLFEDVEELIGDRSSDVEALVGREWDAVVDTCAFSSADIETVAGAVAESVGHYVLVSTIGVYTDWPAEPIADESAPVHEDDGDGYERGKAAAERAAESRLPGRVMHARAGVIVGPHEYVGRLPWWLNRMADGGRVPAPGPPQAPLQLIDVRDLAAYMVSACERRTAGPRNLVAPPGAFAWAELLEACHEVTGSGAELVWVDGHRVAELVEDPWVHLPLWPIPGRDSRAIYLARSDRAIGEGLAIRPLVETVADTWRALLAEGLESGWRTEVRVAGLDREREAELLALLA